MEELAFDLNLAQCWYERDKWARNLVIGRGALVSDTLSMGVNGTQLNDL